MGARQVSDEIQRKIFPNAERNEYGLQEAIRSCRGCLGLLIGDTVADKALDILTESGPIKIGADTVGSFRNPQMSSEGS